MIEIRPEDVGKKIFDTWTRGWMEVSFVAPGYVFLESDLFICKPDGTFNGAQRFSWEETPLPELRKRPRDPVKIEFEAVVERLDTQINAVTRRREAGIMSPLLREYIGKNCKVTCALEAKDD